MAAVWLLPLCSDVLSLLRHDRRAGLTSVRAEIAAPRLLFLIPAHNEEAHIEGSVRSILGMRSEGTVHRVVVVADNCQDATADRARSAGAQVVERCDPTHPGKPAAIAWLLEQVSIEGFDAVVVVDADTKVDPGFAEALTDQQQLRERVVQAHFGTANPGDSWLTRLASLFEDVRYLGQFPRKVRAGLNVVLTGNGMCIGTRVLARLGWVADALTEDLELYARYTLAGVEIGFAPRARLFALEARDLKQARIQRRRWQAGRMAVFRNYLLPTIRNAGIDLPQKVDLLAELSFPGPVAHAVVAAAGSLLLLASGPLSRTVGCLFLASVFPTALWTIRALGRREDRAQLCLDLLRLPVYGAWRLATTIGIAPVGKPMRWERSPR